jgi:hypothetical protein
MLENFSITHVNYCVRLLNHRPLKPSNYILNFEQPGFLEGFATLADYVVTAQQIKYTVRYIEFISPLSAIIRNYNTMEDRKASFKVDINGTPIRCIDCHRGGTLASSSFVSITCQAAAA